MTIAEPTSSIAAPENLSNERAPIIFTQGTRLVPYLTPQQRYARMQAELAASDAWRRSPDVVARHDEGGNAYFTTATEGLTDDVRRRKSVCAVVP